MEEREVIGFREAGAENAVIDHGEVERRNEEIIGALFSSGGRHLRRRVVDISDDFDCPAHLVLIELQFHISFTQRGREGGRERATTTKEERKRWGIYRWRVSGALWESFGIF